MPGDGEFGSRSLHEHYHALIRGERKGIGPALERLGLWTLSWPYIGGVWLRNWAFDRRWRSSEMAPVPVVSIGNLTVGGTGKTPCVETVARFYRGLHVRVAILSRGYGTEAGRNDEALVLEQNLPDVPHLQGADRAALARVAAQELESQVLVLDDGFQHRRLKRSLDIVLIDAMNPWGHGYLLPRGLLREPVSSLARAHAVVVTRCDLVDAEALAAIRVRSRMAAPHASLIETAHEPSAWQNTARVEVPVPALQGRPVAAFCGIGNPGGFRKTLGRLGVDIVAWRTFPDHHAYSRDDLEELGRWAHQQPADAALVTTQKDLVKIGVQQLGDRELWALRIRLRILSGAEVLEDKLRQVVPGCS
jgi:tetraacyldisaccharide 4'-kinase